MARAGQTPEQRSRQARLAAHILHATRDPKETTAAATKAGPGSIDYFERQVDPDGLLEPVERRRRAESAKKAYFLKLSMKSAAARRRSA